MPNAVTYAESSGRPDHVFVIVDANDENGICRLEAQGAGRPDLLFSRSFNCAPNATWSGDVLRDDVAMGIDMFTALCPPASAMTTLAERVRACREGRGGFAEPIRHPPPPPLPPVVTPGVRLCPTPSGGVAGCETDVLCERAKTDLEALRQRAAAVCNAIAERRRDREEALTNAFFFITLAIVLLVLAVIANAFAVFGGASVGVALASASAVASTIAFALLARSEILFNEMNILADEYLLRQREYRNAFFQARTVCVCPGCGVPSTVPETLPRCPIR